MAHCNADRSLVRVEVLAVPRDETPYPDRDVRLDTRPLKRAEGRFTRPRFEINIMHVPSLTSLRAWCPAPLEQSVARLHPLLRARVENEGGEDSGVVRRYLFGPSPLVRDRRTGRRTGRLDQVLNGEKDFLL